MIVKVTSYTKIRKAAKATVRYIMHRPNREGSRAARDLFGEDGFMEKYHAYAMVDGAQKGSVFYRVALSPDPSKEDTFKDLDLVWLTQAAIRHMKEKLKTDFHCDKDIQFFAAVHGDQSEVRHVNAVLIISGRLTKEQFRALPKLLRQAACIEAMKQRRELDQTEEVTPVPDMHWLTMAAVRSEPETQRARFSAPLLMPQTCPNCGPDQRLWRVDEGIFKCPECREEYQLGMGTALQSRGGELSL